MRARICLLPQGMYIGADDCIWMIECDCWCDTDDDDDDRDDDDCDDDDDDGDDGDTEQVLCFKFILCFIISYLHDIGAVKCRLVI